jgi:hypothetical protein
MESLEIRSLIVGDADRRSDAFLAHPEIIRFIAMIAATVE